MNLVRKYQNYRARLKAEFLLVGEEPGHSLPVDARKSDHVHFGDATVFLGWYIGILATEHLLLSKNRLPSPPLNSCDTLKELHFALKALERLINTAPGAFETSSQQPCDEIKGFFIRDDVSCDLKVKFDVERVVSDFEAEDRFQKEESQDQLIHLLLGLALVKKCVTEDICIQGTSLLELSRQLAAKICTWPSRTKWTIRNPYCEDKRVSRGSRAYFFSYPIAASLQCINENETALFATVRRRYKFLWRYLMKHNVPCIYNPTNCHLALTLACISNSWGVNSLKYIFHLSQRYDWPVYPMLNVAFHHDLEHLSSSSRLRRYVTDLIIRAEAMLKDAPWDGPSYEGSPRGWKASHRFLAGPYAQNYGFHYHEEMRFPGVDFMLLHNIYQIIKNP